MPAAGCAYIMQHLPPLRCERREGGFVAVEYCRGEKVCAAGTVFGCVQLFFLWFCSTISPGGICRKRSFGTEEKEWNDLCFAWKRKKITGRWKT